MNSGPITEPCETCGGTGYTVGPVCCGNVTVDGQCWCGSPVPERLQCHDCNGSGIPPVEAWSV